MVSWNEKLLDTSYIICVVFATSCSSNADMDSILMQ